MFKYKLRYIPNTLGVMRIAISVGLIPLFLVIWLGGHPFSSESTLAIVTLSFFMFAGFTDIIDGTIARWIPGGQSNTGATIDGISDMIMVVVSFVFFIPIMDFSSWVYPTFLAGLGFKSANGLFAVIKNRKSSILLHTYGIKLLGFLLFTIPILYFFVGAAAWLEIHLIVVISYLALMLTEEILITIMLKGPNQDIKSIFMVKRENEKYLAKLEAEKAGESKPEVEPAPVVSEEPKTQTPKTTVAKKTPAKKA
ncbi:MAG: CDP-alcohol phosphatidyltransferase family protein [Firmicutes bacterium]|nr:CDP-alcohol phosphatidyltransferase family protein [Bacillota bacterium]